MKLEEFLSPYSLISLAGENDYTAIETFLTTVSMELSGMNLRYDFPGGFTSFLANQTAQAFIFLIKNNDETIQGCGVISLRHYFHSGQKISAAYLSDVRIGPGVSESGRRQWKQCYHDLIHQFSQIDEFKNCISLFAAVFNDNKKAMSHIQKSRSIKYHSLHHYHVLTLMGPSPLRSLASVQAHSEFTLQWCTTDDDRELFQFIKNQNDKKDWAEYYCPGDPEDEWERRKNNWDGHHPSEFLVARDSQRRIVGAFMPWSPAKGRKMVINKLSRGFKLLNVVLRVMKKKTYREGGPFSLLYLTHLNLHIDLSQDQKARVLQQMIDQLYLQQIAQNYHGVVFSHSTEKFLAKIKQKYLSHQIQSTVFVINPDSRSLAPIKTMALEAAIL